MLDGINRHMRAIIRLAETRAALKVYVSKQELVTYEELAGILGVSVGKGFMDTLAAVSRDDHNNGRPICSSIVVSTKESFPGSGFFDHAVRLGAMQTWDQEDDEDVTTGSNTLTKEYHERMVFWLTQLHKLGYEVVAMASGNTAHDLPDIDVALATKVIADLNAADDYGDDEDDEEEPGETDWDEDDDSTDE